MKIRFSSFICRLTAFVAVGAVLVAPVQASAAVTNQSIAAPLYAKPGSNSFWDDVRSAGSNSVPFVVANPDNGPGKAVDPAYTAALDQNAAANIRTLGYVQTNFQARNFKEAYNDINTWYQLYPQAKGIYIDLIKEGGQEEACYVSALYNHVKNIRPNDLVILGSGGHLSPTYEPYGDIFANANTDYGTYKAWKIQYKGFEDKVDYQNRFWHLIYGVSSDNYSSAFADARRNNAGWVFITDKSAPTPFSETPSFWQNEASDVGTIPSSTFPNRGKTSLPRGCISLSSSADSTVDTRTAKVSTTTSSVSVNNISPTYDSEPTTTAQVMSIPKGVNLATLEAGGWACDVNSKSCSYDKTIPASTSTAKVNVVLTAGCDYGGGDATLRLTNFAGNRWDLKLPLKPPFGCDPSSPAGKINTDKSGQLISLTTHSVETTPEIKPLGSENENQAAPKEESKKEDGSIVKSIAIAVIILILLGLGVWGFLWWHKRARYSVKL